MNNMDKIIEKAISGGWSPMNCWTGLSNTSNSKVLNFWVVGQDLALQRWFEAILMDPLFWHSLGKACGWCEQMYTEKQNATPGFWYLDKALYFHEKNLTTSFEEAVAWLGKVVEG